MASRQAVVPAGPVRSAQRKQVAPAQPAVPLWVQAALMAHATPLVCRARPVSWARAELLVQAARKALGIPVVLVEEVAAR